MAIVCENNSIYELLKYAPLRCDTYFKHNIILAANFFCAPNIEWVPLGSILNNIRNGMNVNTDYYSMDETNYNYISVSQIKEYGLIKKNQNYLVETITDLSGYFEITENMLLVTRSGTIGVALSSLDKSFDLEENTYIASGFVITAEMQNGFSSKIIASYMNLFPVQRYVIAMSAGACQKNISQSVIAHLPIPRVLLQNCEKYEKMFAQYETEYTNILAKIEDAEKELEALKDDVSTTITKQIIMEYN